MISNFLNRLLSARMGKEAKQGLKLIRQSMATAQVAPAGVMLSKQHELQRLPVPSLQKTLELYLKSVQPLLTEEEYSATDRVVKAFGKSGGIGEKLHKLLQERAANTENWLSDWWLQTAYLEFRMPVVVYSSPGIQLPLQNFRSKDDQLKYAAKLIAATLEFKSRVDRNDLPVEMMGSSPLDMSQYKKIFCTCRVPMIPCDELHHYGEEPDAPTHIIVVHNNHFFQVEVYDENGNPYNEDQILPMLEQVVQMSQFAKAPIGVLTTEQRDVWAKAYKKMIKDKQNRTSVETIKQGCFVVCLDQPLKNQNPADRQLEASYQLLLGGRNGENAGNRWCDKTVQFIVGAEGNVGALYEHCPAEGPPIASLIDHIAAYIDKTRDKQWQPSSPSISPNRLKFNLSEETVDAIDRAGKELDTLVKDVDLQIFSFDTYGKEFVKSCKLSPDSFIQMALQLAFFRLHGVPPATYESASTRKFLHGRTETIRSCSIESLAFCKTMQDHSASPMVRSNALRAAVDAHKRYTNMAVNGEGVDRLLLGLKKIAIENGLNIPELYMDPAYSTSTHFRLSTSQVSAKCDAVMFYGAGVPDGYGCCYNPRANAINFGLSAFNSCPDTVAEGFKNSLATSLVEMHNCLAQSQKSKL